MAMSVTDAMEKARNRAEERERVVSTAASFYEKAIDKWLETANPEDVEGDQVFISGRELLDDYGVEINNLDADVLKELDKRYKAAGWLGGVTVKHDGRLMLQKSPMAAVR